MVFAILETFVANFVAICVTTVGIVGGVWLFNHKSSWTAIVITAAYFIIAFFVLAFIDWMRDCEEKEREEAELLCRQHSEW